LTKLEREEFHGKFYEAEIGVIENTFLGIEDHGILTFIIYLRFDGSGQGAGTYSLDGYDKTLGKRVGSPAMAVVIRSILETVGVDSWEGLKGRRVVALRDELYGQIKGLTNLPPDKTRFTIFDEIFERN
jgi:hypothetical protein